MIDYFFRLHPEYNAVTDDAAADTCFVFIIDCFFYFFDIYVTMLRDVRCCLFLPSMPCCFLPLDYA